MTFCRALCNLWCPTCSLGRPAGRGEAQAEGAGFPSAAGRPKEQGGHHRLHKARTKTSLLLLAVFLLYSITLSYKSPSSNSCSRTKVMNSSTVYDMSTSKLKFDLSSVNIDRRRRRLANVGITIRRAASFVRTILAGGGRLGKCRAEQIPLRDIRYNQPQSLIKYC